MTVLSSTIVKSARKPWRCDECRRKFSAGTTYHSQTIKDGEFYTIKSCPTCHAIWQRLFREGFDNEPGYVDEEVQEVYGSWEAADAKFGTTGVTGA